MKACKNKIFLIISLTLFLVLSIPSYAFAMHISEGILPLPWAGFWLILAVVFIVPGIIKIKKRKAETPSYMPFLGIMGAAVFVFSALPIPVPIAGTSSHPAGTGMSAILIGPFASVVVSAIALLAQALFMAHGGLTTLGANILSMGVVGSFAGYGAYKGFQKSGASIATSAFAAGFAADIATYATTSIELALGIHGTHPVSQVALKIFIAFLPTQIPLAVLEGLVTAGMFSYVLKHRPDILRSLSLIKAKTEVAGNEV
ncbi:MAG: energy-coupling factor ABC transporter permease [Actinobacteria bacterium]|nr:energy-coupling factor ABC transporter permease [Actinomycetota bacterium]